MCFSKIEKMENEVEEKSVLLENLYNLHRGIDYIYQKQNYKMKLENDRRKAKQIQAQLQNLLESNSSNKIEKMMRQRYADIQASANHL